MAIASHHLRELRTAYPVSRLNSRRKAHFLARKWKDRNRLRRLSICDCGASTAIELATNAAYTMTKKSRKTADLSTVDSFLDEEGTREAFQAAAIKEVLAGRFPRR